MGLGSKRFEHRCIVELFNVFNSSELFVEVTEYLGGGDLYKHVQKAKQQLDEYTVCYLIRRLLLALQYLHTRRLIHRSVRLSQILLASKDDLRGAKLGDLWCVARIPKKGILIDPDRPVDMLTTAPEVLRKGEWSEKADIWSVGCVLFELLHGHPPFGGKDAALMQRICVEDPEFDVVCGAVSSGATELIRMLLRRNPGHRPTAQAALEHRWFKEFGCEKPAASVKRIVEKIKAVKIMGKPPLCRAGMDVSNLLDIHGFNPGFCTYLGLTSCSMDFEILGDAEWQEYWVTSVLVSLWGTAENPRIIILQDSVRPDAPFVDIMTHTIEDITCTEARLDVDRPLRRARLLFRKNFGGVFGIALRKITFYGYEARSVPVHVDMDLSTYKRGAMVKLHNAEITQQDLGTKLHKSLRGKDLSQGQCIPGSNRNFMVFRDICSGRPYYTTGVETQRLELPPGVELCAAVLGLRYVSASPPFAAPPRLRVNLLQELPDGTYRKDQLFETGDLNPPEWRPDQIQSNGYMDLPAMYRDGLSVSTDIPLKVELTFDNRAGVMHTPAVFGLVFYYIPELTTPESEHLPESEDEVKESNAEVGKTGTRSNVARDAAHSTHNPDSDQISERAESEQHEQELLDKLAGLRKSAVFGHLGTSTAATAEPDVWQPSAPELTAAVLVAHGRPSGKVLWPPWWAQPGGDSQEGSTGHGDSAKGSGGIWPPAADGDKGWEPRSQEETPKENRGGRQRHSRGITRQPPPAPSKGALKAAQGPGHGGSPSASDDWEGSNSDSEDSSQQGAISHREVDKEAAREAAVQKAVALRHEALENAAMKAEIRRTKADQARLGNREEDVETALKTIRSGWCAKVAPMAFDTCATEMPHTFNACATCMPAVPLPFNMCGASMAQRLTEHGSANPLAMCRLTPSLPLRPRFAN